MKKGVEMKGWLKSQWRCGTHLVGDSQPEGLWNSEKQKQPQHHHRPLRAGLAGDPS